MRIERRQHAVDGVLDQLLVFRLLDIIGAHALEHVAEDRQLLVGVAAGRIRRDRAAADEMASMEAAPIRAPANSKENFRIMSFMSFQSRPFPTRDRGLPAYRFFLNSI
jgi:hypothetical protein